MAEAKKHKYQQKDGYLNAALDIISEVGVEKLTMRKVADRLNVSPMAIYKHFTNKDELLKVALDEFIARADVLPEHDLPWDEWVCYVGKGMYTTLQGETSWLPILGSFDIGENALKITHAFLAKLMAEGFELQEAIEAYLAMVHLVIGAVTIQSAVNAGGEIVAKSIAGNITESFEPLEKILNTQQIDISLPLLVSALKEKLNAKKQHE